MHAFFVAKGRELGQAFSPEDSYAVVPLGAMMEFLGRAGEPVVMEEVSYSAATPVEDRPTRKAKKKLSAQEKIMKHLRAKGSISSSGRKTLRLRTSNFYMALRSLKEHGLVKATPGDYPKTWTIAPKGGKKA